MRNIVKSAEPQVLVENKDAWDAALRVNPSEHNKNKYRHPEIKRTLLSETASKCVYCESKIGHNCPGDVEHKVPKSKRIEMIFDWNNMTIACTECNRRKGEYYDPHCMFLDPNVDDVESMVQHVGPMVFNVPGDKRSEVTVRILEINSLNGRRKLIGRKIELLESTKNLVERVASENNQVLKKFLIEELYQHGEVSSEYSGMLRSYIEALPADWANKANSADTKSSAAD